jgi:type II secretory pathway predicted ATPase ExeA
MLLKNEAKKRVMFVSDFGTGKTSLLRTKAKQLLDRNEEVVIISFEDKDSSQDSLLTNMLRAEFNEDTVFSLRGPGNKYHKKGSDNMIAMYFYTFRSFW